MFYDIILQKPKIEGRRIIYSWNKNPLLKNTSFWIEYPDPVILENTSYEVLAPYLPVCLGFAAFGKACVHLPKEADRSGNDEAIAIMRKIYKNLWWAYLLNFLSSPGPLCRNVKKPGDHEYYKTENHGSHTGSGRG